MHRSTGFLRVLGIYAGTICVGVTSALAMVHAAEDPPLGKANGRPTITSSPQIDPEIHALMQSRKFADAVKAIDRQLGQDATPDRDYLTYLKAVVQDSAGQPDDALESYKALERLFPDSPWTSRARFGRAGIAAASRDYGKAGEIYRAEAQRLLSRGRKDELSQIYLEFADRYFEGVPAKDPSQEKQPDYKQALEYFREAVKLGPSLESRRIIEFRIARCLQELGENGEAIAAYQAFLKEHSEPESTVQPIQLDLVAPVEADVEAEVRFQLGLTQLNSHQPASARRTWQTFLTKQADERANEAVAAFLAKAQYRLSHTYGLPSPNSIGDLELAVTLAEKFLVQYPEHPLAAKAELEIAQGYMRHGRYLNAVERLEKLIANPSYADSEHLPLARQMLGKSYLAQRKFDDAIAAWKAFLEEHPTDSNWPSVQQEIIDTEFAAAADAHARKDFANARELWQTFLNKYPLDARAAQVLYTFGDMNHSEAAREHAQRVEAAKEQGKPAADLSLNKKCRELYEAAIADWRRVTNKYPGTDQASLAMLRIGQTLELQLDRRAEALESYKKVTGEQESNAQRRIALLTKPQLQVLTQRKYRSDEKPQIKLTTRNLKQVTIKVYKIDMADYFRKMHLASGVEKLDIALIDPDEQFVHTVDDYEDYKQVDREVLLPIDGPGVTAVTVSSDKLEATTMVVVSDLDVIVKSSRNELFLFAENMLTGKPAAGVSVLVSDGSSVFAELLTDDDGITRSTDKKLQNIKDLRVFAIHDGHVASTVTNLNGLDFAVGLAPAGHLFSDRPVYRPGELVNIKGIVRWVDGDRFTFKSGTKFKLDVYDSRGRVLKTEDVALNPYGTIHTHLMLPASTPVGDCRVHLHRPETTDGPALSFESRFQIQTYKLEPIELKLETDKNVYFRGDEITANITLQYYYGAPLANESIRYSLGGGDNEVLTGTTDKDGKLEVKLSTDRFSETQPLTLNVNCPERNVGQSRTVFLATRGFSVSVETARPVFINGETFDATVRVVDPAGEPVATKVKMQVFRVVTSNFGLPAPQNTTTGAASGEEFVEEFELETDDKTGRVVKTLTAGEGGRYIVRAIATDQFDNEISGQSIVAVSGEDDDTRLRVLADRHNYRVGDTATIRVHWREAPALALITFDGASVLGHRLVDLRKGINKIEIPIESHLAPNFFLNAAVMQRNRFHQAQSGFVVDKKLSIELTTSERELAPGEKLTVELAVTDSAGKPTTAEISLAMIQANLMDRFGSMQSSIVDAFQGQMRTPRVRQASSCTFSYQTRTREINEALLVESRRLREELAERDALMTMGNVDNDGDGVLDDPFGSIDDLFGSGPEPNASAAAVAGDTIVGDFAVSGNEPWDRADNNVFSVEGNMPLPFPNASVFNDLSMSRMHQSSQQLQQAQSEYAGQAMPQMQMGHRFATPGLLDRTRQEIEAKRREVFAYGMLDVERSSVSDAPMGQQQANVWFNGTSNQQFDASFLSSQMLQRRDLTINGFTTAGKLIVLNGRGVDEVLQLTRKDGLQVIPLAATGETGFWDPADLTDEQGKAQIEITMPTDSTAWRLQAVAVNVDGLTGETTADVVTRKNLFGQMRLAAAFTVGDKSIVQAEVHSSLNGARSVDVTLKTTIGSTSIEQTKTVRIDGPSITPIGFPVEILDGQQAEFELRVVSKTDNADASLSDTTQQTVPIEPYGLPVYQTASGTASQNTLALIDLADISGAQPRSLELLIGGNVNRSLLDSLLGGPDLLPLRCAATSVLRRSASDAMGGVALLEMVRRSIGADSPQATQLGDAISSAVSNLIASQRDDGGWNEITVGNSNPDPLLTARIMWALADARSAGFAVPNDAFDKGKAYLKTAFTKETRLDQQSILLSAMARCGCGDFALANRLHRERNRLSPLGVTHLMLSLTALGRGEMARELIDLVDTAKFDARQSLDQSARRDHTSIELASLYLLALQELKVRPETRTQLATWLLTQRVGSRWPVEDENGPAIAAMAKHHSTDTPRGETIRLSVFVNGNPLETLEIQPNDPSRRLSVPREMILDEGEQKIDFRIEGRGEFTYSAVMTGFAAADKVASSTQDWRIDRRYEPDQLRVDGKLVPRGFSVVSRTKSWTPNPLTQLTQGTRGQVTLSARVNYENGKPIQAYLVLVEPIPAGCTILDESIRGRFDRYEIHPGAITFYLGEHQSPGDIHYTLVGYLPGDYRVPPTVLRSYYDPSQMAVADAKSLTVLPPGEKSSDEYRLTPDEMFHLGKIAFDKAEYQKAHEHLSQLLADWPLRPDSHKDTVVHLFNASQKLQMHADTVKYFEVLKERFPEVELSFESILQVAQSYREISEYERSYLVYRATVQASFERENQVAGFLNKRGEFLRGVQTMEALLRDYPAESYVATANYSLAQEVYRRADTGSDDKRLQDAGVTRADLISGSIQMLDHFLTRWPSDPSSDQASFALTTGLIDMKRYQAAIDRADRYSANYPNSKLLDSFWYMTGYCHFELQHPDQAIAMCRKVADAEFIDPATGSARQSDNKWEAVYIMGQVYHSLGKAAEAIDQYAKVSERFADAAEAIEYFSRKSIELPDVTTLAPADKQTVELKFRNVPETLVKVYRIDLMKFGLTQRNLNRITAINLAGIKPYHQETVALGDGKDYRDRDTKLELPLKDEGAYLVVCRSENLYTSGLVVVSPLVVAVQEDTVSGRVRVSVKNRSTDAFVNKVHVKVIGSGNDEFQSGETDLRGLFIADGIIGTSTVIAVSENQEYAFFRGESVLQPSQNQDDPFGSDEQMQRQEAVPQSAAPMAGKKMLLENVFRTNSANQLESQMQFDGLIENDRTGVKSKEAY
ncbi:tetratricopeptide repeat protein [Stieleria varia]|uniref:Outer membrane protein assembly factor BamD n=1 Tax=Stieleria varia TaxID=2528005 RepID=A0A5C6B2I5_9BACT|nr:tetratricopeptide repeat protein [Stieleria varia]TWU06037.1 Outer membrane protein assembly factor BamD [Stieleria varia]